MFTSDKLKLLSLTQLHGLLVFLGLPAGTAAPEAAVLFRELKRLKSELGNQGLAGRLGLNPAEMDEFSKALRELERALGTADMEERNRQLAILRFLSWLEALHAQNPGLAFTADLEALISEELGRKQVRALELILRSLVSERYGDQKALEQGLTELLSGPLVAKWKQAADAGDLLSGTTFSELASLFVNTQEYPNYQPLFEGGPFLSYLKDKRKTIQNFLEDMRRIRNLLAHNKRISNTQLSLLDLYYEELISPVQQAHDQGQTRVNPDTYLEVSKEELEGYFNKLQQDIIGVKDDIAAFRAAIEANLGDIKADTADIRAATGSIGKRQKQIAIGVVLVLLGIGLLLYLVFGTQQDTSAIKQQGAQTARVAEETKAAVEATREDVQKGSQAMQQAAESVATSSAAMRASVEDIREGFSSLSKLGGVIDRPERPEQFYHNARIFELRGDFLNARKSYEHFLGFGLDVIDPYLRYLEILKAQDGAAGAAASYRGVSPAEPGPAFRAVASLLQDGAERGTALRAVIEQHPSYAPAYYLLSQQYSQKFLGQQSMSNKHDEKQLLEAFLRLANAGSFQQYFIDKNMASEWLEDAETRLKALASIDAQTSEPPFVYTAMRSNSGWTLTVNLREVARKFYYKMEGQADFIDTGQGNYIDQRLNAPAANTWFDLPPTQGEATLLVKYEDINGKLIGPFAIEFNPMTELIRDQKRTLEMTRNSWLSFRNDPDYPFLYFTHLLSNRCAIEEVRYGLDRETPDTLWPGIGKDCNMDDPSSIDGDTITYIEVPATSRFATVQLRYRDGTRSDVVKIPRLN